jgi:hypothetical protein
MCSLYSHGDDSCYTLAVWAFVSASATIALDAAVFAYDADVHAVEDQDVGVDV